MRHNFMVLLAMIVVLGLSVVACQPAQSADIGIFMRINQHSEVRVPAGSNITIQLDVSRQDHGPASNGAISVTEHLQDGLIFLSGSGPGVECTAEGQEVTCLTFAQLYYSSGKTMDLQIAVDPRMPAGTITNTAQVIYAGDTNSQNNSASTTLTVTPPTLATQELDFTKAMDAGAQFPVTILNNKSCTQPGDHLGLSDWTDPTFDNSDPEVPEENPIWSKTGGRHAGIEMIAYCGGSGRGEAEAFVGAFAAFKLKNGWLVKSYDQADYNHGLVTFDLDLPPAVGQCRPNFKAHLHSYGSGVVNGLLTTAHLVTVIWITIEGPVGTDPYNGSPSVFCEP